MIRRTPFFARPDVRSGNSAAAALIFALATVLAALSAISDGLVRGFGIGGALALFVIGGAVLGMNARHRMPTDRGDETNRRRGTYWLPSRDGHK